MTAALPRVLVVEDKENYRELICEILQDGGFDGEGAGDGAGALDLVRKRRFDLVVTDLFLPDREGFDVMVDVHRIYPDIPILIVTAFGSVERAVEAVKRGAFDFLPKPFSPDQLLIKLRQALREVELKRENRVLKESDRQEELIGQSPAFLEAIEKLRQVASTEATVLLLGESGTGKELFAKRLHRWSERKDAPFLSLNSAAIPENLLETELFGHEKGAFTGAYREKMGKLELAHPGTLFLDEIGDLPLVLQPKLLRVLEEKSFERVGGVETRRVDLRFLFATHRDLKRRVGEGLFREDLYFRLTVFPVEIPPLRERRDDIPLLVSYFVERLSKRLRKDVFQVQDKAMEKLLKYSWPGNVRELQNAVERALILCKGESLGPEEFFLDGGPTERADLSGTLKDALERAEREKILATLRLHPERREAAELLGISAKTLLEKLRRYGLGEDS